MNRVTWDGDKKNLQSWDDIAGDPTTYEKTYIPDGNTLVMMSMNVHPAYQGAGYARKLIEEAIFVSIDLGVDFLIGSFRPNEYGKHKAIHKKDAKEFQQYVELKRPDGLPVDSWLRNLTRNGMRSLSVDHHAMTVTESLNELDAHAKNYNPDMWKEVSRNIWECGEVGSWYIDHVAQTATYKESNLWGIIWKKPGLL